MNYKNTKKIFLIRIVLERIPKYIENMNLNKKDSISRKISDFQLIWNFKNFWNILESKWTNRLFCCS